MSGKTHAIIGANVAWLAALLGYGDERAILFVIAGAGAALLPDIDADDAKIHHVAGGVLHGFRGGFHHRGFFHFIIRNTKILPSVIPAKAGMTSLYICYLIQKILGGQK